MAMERTFSMIKPDAVSRNLIGEITSRFEKAGLKIVASKLIQMTEAQAKAFYVEHVERPFYEKLVNYMTSAPTVVQILEGENAIKLNRELMGATNPLEAEEGTIRKDFALDNTLNSVHGSDSEVSAKREMALFFSGFDIHSPTESSIIK